jgi:hypothetical protein
MTYVTEPKNIGKDQKSSRAKKKERTGPRDPSDDQRHFIL